MSTEQLILYRQAYLHNPDQCVAIMPLEKFTQEELEYITLGKKLGNKDEKINWWHSILWTVGSIAWPRLRQTVGKPAVERVKRPSRGIQRRPVSKGASA